jgi:hypothetical protein
MRTVTVVPCVSRKMALPHITTEIWDTVARCFLANGSHLWDLQQGPTFVSSETLSLRDLVRVVCVHRVVAGAVHGGAGGNHGGLRRAVNNT